MAEAVFVTDLHGKKQRYLSLLGYLSEKPADVLLIGGDLFPPFMMPSSPASPAESDFINGFMGRKLRVFRQQARGLYPAVFLIMGNDDPGFYESALISAGLGGLWTYIHHRKVEHKGFAFFGYNYVPPTPFLLKDWERYDVSRYTDVGCISPEEGRRSFPVSEHEKKWTTIKEDLNLMTHNEDLSRSVFLFHAPPYDTLLDYGDLKDTVIDHVPVDPHLGSIAVSRFIEERQPLLTLHGHVHESSRLSGSWLQKIGTTVCINGAYEGEELSLIRIPLDEPENAVRFLL